ncbi:MAG: hypothetical protein JRF40_12035 [Deltaproteobacteria bacterium]|nr:hypothetical protein [Deltaproteobacteria bacterium]
MAPDKLTNMLSIISDNLTEKQIPFCLIGAFALGLYGFPRYTSDFDLLTEGDCWTTVSSIMENLGYACYQKTDAFAQFDSESGVYGKVDFMFVTTQDGRDILKRSFIFNDESIGNIPVIQPTDYVILKLMAIANNPDRSIKDESDIAILIDLYNNNLIPDDFNPIEKNRIMFFAERFGQEKLAEKYLADDGVKKNGQNKL